MTMLDPLTHRETISVDLNVVRSLTRQAPAELRAWIAATLRRWGLWQLVDDAGIVLTELVNNACQAGADDLLVLVDWQRDRDRFVVAVWDDAPGVPAKRELDYFAESGRGLHLIESLSTDWGHRPDTRGPGKTVWVCLYVGENGGRSE
ncbi:ATP-binding protein [Spirillospora sp. CA-108201]